MADPVAYLRRSPLRRRLEPRAPRGATCGDAAIAESVGDAAAPAASSSPTCRRCRASASRAAEQLLPRRAAASLSKPTPNRAFRQPDGGLCLVLAPGEIILLSNLAGDGERLAQLEASWRIEDEERTYPLPRRDSHAWLAVAGEAARRCSPSCAPSICGRDKFADLAIAQTSIAKMSAILVRADIGANPVFHLLVDSAAAVYFCDCLLDAADEFGGRIVGLKALQKLEGG